MTALQERLNQLQATQEPVEKSNFDDVELTLEEHEAAIRAAKQEKYIRQKREEWYNKVTAQPVWARPSALDYYNGLMKSKSMLGKKFQVHEKNIPVITQLCLYFSHDNRFGTDPKTGTGVFQENELNPDKGILLMGNPGTGKNHLLNFFSKNPKASYLMPTTVHIAEKYRTGWNYEGQDTVSFYSKNPKAEVGHPWNQKQLGYCFHDLGVEGVKKNFGNELNVMETILFNRYESRLPFYTTHITTNLNADQIEQTYGSRIRSRLKEMFNVFVCDWESFR